MDPGGALNVQEQPRQRQLRPGGQLRTAALAAQRQQPASITQSDGSVPYRTVGIYDTALDLDGTTPGGTTVRLGYACSGRYHAERKRGFERHPQHPFGRQVRRRPFQCPVGPRRFRPRRAGRFQRYYRDPVRRVRTIVGVSYNAVTSPFPCCLSSAARPRQAALRSSTIPASGDVETRSQRQHDDRLPPAGQSPEASSSAVPRSPPAAHSPPTPPQRSSGAVSTPSSYLTSVFDLGDIAPTGLTNAQFLAAMNNLSGDSVWTEGRRRLVQLQLHLGARALHFRPPRRRCHRTRRICMARETAGNRVTFCRRRAAGVIVIADLQRSHSSTRRSAPMPGQ